MRSENILFQNNPGMRSGSAGVGLPAAWDGNGRSDRSGRSEHQADILFPGLSQQQHPLRHDVSNDCLKSCCQDGYRRCSRRDFFRRIHRHSLCDVLHRCRDSEQTNEIHSERKSNRSPFLISTPVIQYSKYIVIHFLNSYSDNDMDVKVEAEK